MNLKRIGKASTLNWDAWKDFVVNGLIFVASAAITYTLDNVAKLDFGNMTAVIIPVVGLVLKYVQKWIDTYRNQKAGPDEPAPKNPDFPIK